MNALSIFKQQRVPTLVWAGFSLLIVLGLATSLFLLLQLRKTLHQSEVLEAATLNVRASVRSLHAHYMDPELIRALLSPQPDVKIEEHRARKLESDKRNGELLRIALASTHREELEHATARHTPIAAMTAHAMAGDREGCLAAGMDDYISKPLQKADLLDLLDRISSGRSSARAAIPLSIPNGHREPDGSQTLPFELPVRVLPVCSREKLLDQLDADEALMSRMIALFHENTPHLLDDIRGSIARRGGDDLAHSAYALLSSMGAFGAHNASHLTRQLEVQGLEEDYQHTNETFAALERETAEIHLALASFAPQEASIT